MTNILFLNIVMFKNYCYHTKKPRFSSLSGFGRDYDDVVVVVLFFFLKKRSFACFPE